MNRCVSFSSIKRFILASSTVVFGPSLNGPSDEDTPYNPHYGMFISSIMLSSTILTFKQDYAKSKQIAEEVTQEICSQNKLDYITLRVSGRYIIIDYHAPYDTKCITGVYGPDDFFVIYELMKAVNDGVLFFIPGSGDKKLCFTFVDDVVDAFIASVSAGKPNNTYVISTAEAPTIEQWITQLMKVCGRDNLLPFNIHLPIGLCRVVMQLIAPIFNIGKRRTFLYQAETVDRMSEGKIRHNSSIC